jgi:hypothetical protein
MLETAASPRATAAHSWVRSYSLAPPAQDDTFSRLYGGCMVVLKMSKDVSPARAGTRRRRSRPGVPQAPR